MITTLLILTTAVSQPAKSPEQCTKMLNASIQGVNTVANMPGTTPEQQRQARLILKWFNKQPHIKQPCLVYKKLNEILTNSEVLSE